MTELFDGWSPYYVLDGHTPVNVSLDEWMRRVPDRRGPDGDPWRVASTSLFDGVFVSTVFLGVTVDLPGFVPRLFETMVFGLPDVEPPLWRCATWDEAAAQHEVVVAWVEQHVRTRLDDGGR